jgi:hypothetical protein
MKIPTKDYNDYRVGDLILFKEGHYREDVGYIEAYEPPWKQTVFKMRWFKDQSSQISNETPETLQAYEDSYVFPVLKE